MTTPALPKRPRRTHDEIELRTSTYKDPAGLAAPWEITTVILTFPPEFHAQTQQPIKYFPNSDTYEFQEFACAVFELDGYGDITLVNPYNGLRLWISAEELPRGKDTTVYEQMARAIELAREYQFLERDEHGEVRSALVPDEK
jgi:hypothetical protein